MITKTAWKNIWRNRARSFVVIASVTIGVFAGVFGVAVMNGAIAQRVDAALDDEISHIQIVHKDFRANNDLDCSIDNVSALANQLIAIEGVEATAERLLVVGMANTATKSSGVMISGIDPYKEKAVFGLYEQLDSATGDYFEDTERTNLAYIGVDLAKDLNIIRYIINDEVLTRLSIEGMSDELITKLRAYEGKRFNNEKTFKKEMKSVLSNHEQGQYAALITELAQSFRPRSKFTLTFVDRNNMQTGGVFRIGGLYDIPNSMFERSQVFIKDEALRDLIEFPDNMSHQIILRLSDIDNTDELTKKLRGDLPGLEVMSWKEIQPELAMMSEMAGTIYGFLMSLILAALAFGIVNTMLMVVLERTKELGMLSAIGMNKKKIFRMIMTESIFLSLTGGVCGMIISIIIVGFTSTNGIVFSTMQEGFEAMGYSSHIYPDIDISFLFMLTLLIVITGVLSSIYPALKALKLDPAEALRTE